MSFDFGVRRYACSNTTEPADEPEVVTRAVASGLVAFPQIVFGRECAFRTYKHVEVSSRITRANGFGIPPRAPKPPSFLVNASKSRIRRSGETARTPRGGGRPGTSRSY